MPRRGDICEYFNPTLFGYHLEKRYKNHSSFARRMGVSRQAVGYWLNGDRKPTWKNVIKMSKIFNISARGLLVDTNSYILRKWKIQLLFYLESPPEVKISRKTETKTVDQGGSETQSETKTKRELKLSEKGALDLTGRLGIFDDASEVSGEEDVLNALLGSEVSEVSDEEDEEDELNACLVAKNDYTDER